MSQTLKLFYYQVRIVKNQIRQIRITKIDQYKRKKMKRTSLIRLNYSITPTSSYDLIDSKRPHTAISNAISFSPYKKKKE